MRKALMIVAGVLALAAVNWSIHAREALLRDGRVVLLELAPVDPRSLMQGDYMALRFKVADDAFGRNARDERPDGYIVVRPSGDAVATFVRVDDATPLAAGRTAAALSLARGRAEVRDERVLLRGRHGRRATPTRVTASSAWRRTASRFSPGCVTPARRPLGAAASK